MSSTVHHLSGSSIWLWRFNTGSRNSKCCRSQACPGRIGQPSAIPGRFSFQTMSPSADQQCRLQARQCASVDHWYKIVFIPVIPSQLRLEPRLRPLHLEPAPADTEHVTSPGPSQGLGFEVNKCCAPVSLVTGTSHVSEAFYQSILNSIDSNFANPSGTPSSLSG